MRTMLSNQIFVIIAIIVEIITFVIIMVSFDVVVIVVAIKSLFQLRQLYNYMTATFRNSRIQLVTCSWC